MYGPLYLVIAACALAALAAQQDLGPAAQTVGARLGSAVWWHLEPWVGDLAGGTDLAVDVEYRRALGACVHFTLEAAGLLTVLSGAATALGSVAAGIRSLRPMGAPPPAMPMRRPAAGQSVLKKSPPP